VFRIWSICFYSRQTQSLAASRNARTETARLSSSILLAVRHVTSSHFFISIVDKITQQPNTQHAETYKTRQLHFHQTQRRHYVDDEHTSALVKLRFIVHGVANILPSLKHLLSTCDLFMKFSQFFKLFNSYISCKDDEVRYLMSSYDVLFNRKITQVTM